MATDRLRWLDFFHGKRVDAEDWDDFDLALQHWERQIYEGMLRDGTAIYHWPKFTAGAALEIIVGAWSGASNDKPLYQAVDVTVPLITADSGTLTGSTVVSNPASERYIVVTAEYANVPYDPYTDADGAVGNYRQDHGIRYRRFMGAQALVGAGTLPLVDLAAQYVLTKAMPLFVYRRVTGELDTDPPTASRLNKIQRYWVGSDLSRAIRDSAASLGSLGVAQCRRCYLTGVMLDEDDARLPSVTPAAAAAGGTVTLTGDHIFLFGGGALRVQDSSIEQWTSTDLDVSSTYFLRAQLDDYGSLLPYCQKGTLPAAPGASYTYPAGLRGTPGGAVGGEFPSTELDVLLAKVVTGLAGAVPTVTPYRQGDFSHEETIAAANAPTVHDPTITLPTPHACDMAVFVTLAYNAVPGAPAGGVLAIPTRLLVSYYNHEEVGIYAWGQWLRENGVTTALERLTTYRPGVRVVITPKRRPTP